MSPLEISEIFSRVSIIFPNCSIQLEYNNYVSTEKIMEVLSEIPVESVVCSTDGVLN